MKYIHVLTPYFTLHTMRSYTMSTRCYMVSNFDSKNYYFLLTTWIYKNRMRRTMDLIHYDEHNAIVIITTLSLSEALRCNRIETNWLESITYLLIELNYAVLLLVMFCVVRNHVAAEWCVKWAKISSRAQDKNNHKRAQYWNKKI